MDTKVIKTSEQYKAALDAIERLMDSEPETEAAEHLELLTLLVRDYESRNFFIPLPDPVEAIRFRMEQQGLSQRDLVPYFGSRSKVSEVLSGKRSLTVSMIRDLHEGLGIPAESLILKRKPQSINSDLDMDLSRFPIREMISRGWIKADLADVPNRPQALIEQFCSPLGDLGMVPVLYRKSLHVRSGRPIDRYFLLAWTIRVLTLALGVRSNVTYEPGTVNEEFLRKVAQFSWSERGPIIAREFLEKHGIFLIVESPLPKTSLDGAAILMPKDRRPIIAMTLRYDRIDNFWFCLMHELAHIAKHFSDNKEEFFDDLDTDSIGDPRETQADHIARNALIPDAEWKNDPASVVRSPEAIKRLANKLHIHPAIIAGRIRYERKNFRILNHLLGHGRVRVLFSHRILN